MASIKIRDFLSEEEPTRLYNPETEPSQPDEPMPQGEGLSLEWPGMGQAASVEDWATGIANALAYGNISAQIEQAALYGNPEALASLTVRGGEGQLGLRDIARELGIRGRSRMRKAELIQAISEAAPGSENILQRLSQMSGVEVMSLPSVLSERGTEYVRSITERRREVYRLAQMHFGFDIPLTEMALGQQPWEKYEAMSHEEWMTTRQALLLGPLAEEAKARGLKVQTGPGGTVEAFAPRARAQQAAQIEGERKGNVIVPGGMARATLAQSWFLAQGTTREGTEKPPEGLASRGARLFGEPEFFLQAPGIAKTETGEFVVGDPKKWTKRIKNLAQMGRVWFPGLETMRARVRGQTAETAEVVQKARAWVSLTQAPGFLAEGAYLYNPKATGAPYAVISRKVQIPEGEELLVKPGQVLSGKKPLVLFPGHTGLRFGEDYERLRVLQAEVVQRVSSEGRKYSEVLLQLAGEMPEGAPVGLKYLMKGGGYAESRLEQMGVDVFMRPTDVYQLGAAVASIASPELKKQIWGEDFERWGTEHGPKFAEWLSGQLGWRELPETTYQIDNPVTQKLIESGLLKLTNLPEEVTQERLLELAKSGKFGQIKRMLGGTAVTGIQRDYGVELDVGVVPGQQWAYKSQTLSFEQIADIAAYSPRLARQLLKEGEGTRRVYAGVVGAALAQWAPKPGSEQYQAIATKLGEEYAQRTYELGKAYAEKAVPLSEIPLTKFYRQAYQELYEQGLTPEEKTGLLRERMAELVGEAYKGRGIFASTEEGPQYIPNPLAARRFGFQTTEGQQTQLPGAISRLLWAELERRGGVERGGKTQEEAEAAYRTMLGEVSAQMAEVVGSPSFMRSALGSQVAGRRIGGRVVPARGVEHHRYVAGTRMLGQMLRAAGVSEKDLPEVLQLVQSGKLEGPRALAIRDPTLSPEQVRYALTYTPTAQAAEMLDVSPEDIETMYGANVGVSQLVAALGSGDWDLDALSKIVASKYRKVGGKWRVEHLAEAARPEQIIRAAMEAPGAEVQNVLEKIGTPEELEAAVKEKLTGLRDNPPTVTREEFVEGTLRQNVFGKIEMGTMYNALKRAFGGALQGEHPALAKAREKIVAGYQMALDYAATIPQPWQQLKQLALTYNIASGGYAKGKGEGGFVQGGITGLAQQTVRTVLGLTETTGEPLPVEARAAALINPLVAEASFGEAQKLIEQYDAAQEDLVRRRIENQLTRLVDPYAEENLGLEEYTQRLYERSPALRAIMQAGAARAVQKGEMVDEDLVALPSGRGLSRLGKFRRQLARWGTAARELWRATSRSSQPIEPTEFPSRVATVLAAAAVPDMPGVLRRTVRSLTGAIERGRQPAQAEPAQQQPQSPMADLVSRLAAGARPTPVPQQPELGSGLDIMQQALEQAPVETPAPQLTTPQTAPTSAAETGGTSPAAPATGGGPPLPEDTQNYWSPTGGFTPAQFRRLREAARRGSWEKGASPQAGVSAGPTQTTQPRAAKTPPRTLDELRARLTERFEEAKAARQLPDVSEPTQAPAGQPAGTAAAPGRPLDPLAQILGAASELYEQQRTSGEGKKEFRIAVSPETGEAKFYWSRGQQGPSVQEAEERTAFIENIATAFRDPSRRAAIAQAMGVKPSQVTAEIATQAKDLGIPLPVMQKVLQGKPLTFEQYAGEKGLAAAIGSERASYLVGEGIVKLAGGEGPTGGGPTDALQKFTEAVEGAREKLVKYGDVVQEQIELYKRGELKTKDARAWTRDVREMLGQAQAIEGLARGLPGGVPQQYAGDVQRWSQILQQAREAGLVQEFGAGLGGAGRGGWGQRLLAGITGGGSGILGAAGPLAGLDKTFYSLTSGWRLMMMRRLWGMTGGIAMRAIPAAAASEQVAWQAAYLMGGGVGTPSLGGMTADLMAYRARQATMRVQMGEAAYRAWGWTQQAMPGLGTAAGIALPALGAGAIAGVGASLLGLSATGIGLPVAALAGTAGLVGYSRSAMADKEKMALAAAGAMTGGPSWDAFLSGAGMDVYAYRFGNWLDRAAAGLGLAPQPERLTPERIARETDSERLRYGMRLESGDLRGLTPAGRVAAIQAWAKRLTEQERFKAFRPEELIQFAGQYAQYTPVEQLGQIPPDLMEHMLTTGQQPQLLAGTAAKLGMRPEQWMQLARWQITYGQPAFQQAVSLYGQYAPMRRWMEPTEIMEKLLPTRRLSRVAGGWQVTTEKPEWEQMPYTQQRAFQIYAGAAATAAQRGIELPIWQSGMTEAQAAQTARWTQMLGGAEQKWGVSAAELFERLPMPQTPQESWLMGQIFSGNQAVISNVGMELGMPSLVTREPWGLRVGTTTPVPLIGPGGSWVNQGQWMTAMRQSMGRMAIARATGNYIGAAGGLNWAEGSVWRIQDEMRALQRKYAGGSAGMQAQAVQAQLEYLLGPGGTPEQPAQGGLWYAQDLMRQFGYVQHMGGVSPYTGRQYVGSFGWREAQLGLRSQQFGESMGLAQRQFEFQQAMQGERMRWAFSDLSTAWERAGTRREWTREDWAYQRERAGLQFGWQMEDIEEAIRFSTGRQRKQLVRQRERMTQLYGMETSRRDVMEERQRQIWQWEDEDFEKRKRRLEQQMEWQEELARLQRERFEMQKRHFEETQALQRAQLEEQKAAYQEQFEAQKEIIELQRKHQIDQLERQKKMAGAAAAYNKEMQKLQDQLRNTQRGQQVLLGDFQMQFVKAINAIGEAWVDAAKATVSAVGGDPSAIGAWNPLELDTGIRPTTAPREANLPEAY